MRRINRLVFSIIGLGLGTVVASAPASACTNVFDPSFSTCTSFNCSSERVDGTVGSLGAGSALPWCIKVFSFANRCLRAQVTSSTRLVEVTVVEPDGDVFRSVGPVKIRGTSDQGWHTVQVSRFNGDAQFANFTFRYGVYPLNNPNCSNPTTVRSTLVRGEEAADDTANLGLYDSEAAPSAD